MRIIYLIGFLIVFFSFSAYGQNEKFKAIYIYSFTKEIEWPANYSKNDFIIGVYGKSDITRSLMIVAEKKKVGNQTIVVKEYASLSQVEKCHILYIPKLKSSDLTAILGKTAGFPTLIVTEKIGLSARGACVNFIDENGRISFEISKSNIKNKGLKVSEYLLGLGTLVR